MSEDKETKKRVKDSTAIEECVETDGWLLIKQVLEELEDDCRNSLVVVDPKDEGAIIRLQALIEFSRKMLESPLVALEFLDDYRKKQSKE